MKLIIGLGNPGKEYKHTRHNVGWEVVTAAVNNELRIKNNGFEVNKKFQSEIAEAIVGGEKVLFVHPLTFMNESGRAVIALKTFYKCDNRDILLVHDDMDFAVGKMAFTKNAGPAGHNGVASVQEALATTEVARLRIGIGRPTGGRDNPAPTVAQDFVLEKFPVDEKDVVEKIIHSAAEAVKDWIVSGIDKAMNTWNGLSGE